MFSSIPIVPSLTIPDYYLLPCPVVIIITFILMNKTEKNFSLSNQPSDNAYSNEASVKKDDDAHNCAWNSLFWTAVLILVSLFLSIYINVLDFSTKDAAIRSWHIITSVLSALITLGIFLVLANDYIKHRYAWIKGWRTYVIPAICLVGGVLYICTENTTILPCFALIVLMYGCYIYSTTKRQKEPTIKVHTDLLYRSRLFNGTLRFIREHAYNNEKGLTIGICGQWGSGKTFFINELMQGLSKQHCHKQSKTPQCEKPFIVCEKVELWSASTLDDAWNRVIFSLHKGIFGKPPISNAKTNSFLSILTAFSSNLKAAQELAELVFPDFEDLNLQSIIEKMQDRKIVLVIDDLERAEFSIIRAMLPLFERLKSLPNLIVICAVAEDELRQVFIQNDYPSTFSDGHLSKLFDHRIHVPAPNYRASQKMQNKILSEKYYSYNLLKSFLEKYPLKFDAPRQLIQTIEKLASIENLFFSDCKYSFLYSGDDAQVKDVLKRVKYIFFVEILRYFYPDVLSQLKSERNLRYFLENIPNSIVPEFSFSITEEKYSQYLVNEEDKRSHDAWISRNLTLYRHIEQQGLVWSIFIHMREDVSSNMNAPATGFPGIQEFDAAVKGNYTRYTVLEKWELQNLLEQDDCKKLSFTEKIRFHISTQNEETDSIDIPESALMLLKHAFEVMLIDKTDDVSLKNALDAEVNEGNTSALKNYMYLSESYYEHFLLNIFENHNCDSSVVLKFDDIFANLYKLLDFQYKAHLLTPFFHLLNNNFESEETSKFARRMIRLSKTKEFQQTIRRRCEQFGYALCQVISEYPQNFSEQTTNYSIHPYSDLADKTYLEYFEKGIKFYFENNHITEDFIISWSKFLGHQYINTKFIDDVYSSYATPNTCRIMSFILDQISRQTILLRTLSPQCCQLIRQSLVGTRGKLEQDLQEWENSDYKSAQQYIDGVSRQICIVDEMLTKIK